MGRYASNTGVSSDRSVSEIKQTLQRYGAGQFITADDWENGQAMVGFACNGISVRLHVSLPNADAAEFTSTETGRDRKPAAAKKAWEQATRQRWRALALVVKAKLEAVEADITTFEQEFMAHIVLPGGQTVGERLLPQIQRGITTGKMPARLPLFDKES